VRPASAAGSPSGTTSRPLADANGLLVVPEGEPAAEAGRTYDALVLGALA